MKNYILCFKSVLIYTSLLFAIIFSGCKNQAIQMEQMSARSANSFLTKFIQQRSQALQLFSSDKTMREARESANLYKEFVRVVVKNSRGDFLVLSTKYGDKYFWIFPGGEVEGGETKDDAVKRELFEELDLVIPSYKYLGSFFTRPYKGQDWKGYYYLADSLLEENLSLIRNKEPAKCSEIAYLPLEELYERVTIEDSYVTKQILEDFFIKK